VTESDNGGRTVIPVNISNGLACFDGLQTDDSR